MEKDNTKNLSIPEKSTENISTSKYNFPNDYYKNKSQREMINKMFSSEKFDKDNNIKSLLKKKISSYKQQDRHKKLLRKQYPLITLEETIEKLVCSKLKCFYCKHKIYILYKQVRDKYQWTLDRIDNSLGHNKDNVVISCLDCNLTRRTTEMDRFTFTKQLKIKKLDGSESQVDSIEDNIKEQGTDAIKNENTSDIKIIKSEFL